MLYFCASTFTLAANPHARTFADRVSLYCNVRHVKTFLCCKVACGVEHCLALTDSGNVYSWGLAGASLGLGPAVTEEQREGTPVTTPQLVRKLCQVVKICAGARHSLVLARGKEKKHTGSLSSIGSSGTAGSTAGG